MRIFIPLFIFYSIDGIFSEDMGFPGIFDMVIVSAVLILEYMQMQMQQMQKVLESSDTRARQIEEFTKQSAMKHNQVRNLA